LRRAREALLAAACALLALESLSAQALSQRTIDIFDKRNRVLDPPPDALRSNQAELGYRYSAEAQRLKRAPAMDSDAINEAALVEDEDPDNSRHLRKNLRRERRRKAESEYDFAGDGLFGVGFVGAGPYGIFGAEAELAVGKRLYVGAGLGTGMSYSSWALHARYTLVKGQSLNTFFEAGYANWQLGRVSTSGKELRPSYLADRFFSDDGRLDPGEHAHMVYPGLGVVFQGDSGLAASMQVDYLMNLNGFEGGWTAAMGFYFYY
jgi:hypothetical protein